MLQSVIEELLARRDMCPQILVSTHHHTVHSMIPSNDLLGHHHVGSINDNCLTRQGGSDVVRPSKWEPRGL